MLQRQIQIGRDLRIVGDLVQQPILRAVRVAVEHAHPVHALDLAHRAQQLRQHEVPVAEVAAVAAGVLGDQRNLRHALRGKAAALGHDVVEGPGGIIAANQRNRTVGAAVVAAVRDLHVGRVGRGGQNAAAVEEALAVVHVDRALARHGLVQHVVQARVVRHAHEAVHLRHLRGQRVGIALGQTARDEQLFQPAGLLVLRHLKDCVDGLLLGRLDEAAGVDEDDLRLGGIVDDLVAPVAQHAQHVFRIHQIFRAAQGNHAHGGAGAVVHIANSFQIMTVFSVNASILAWKCKPIS